MIIIHTCTLGHVQDLTEAQLLLVMLNQDITQTEFAARLLKHGLLALQVSEAILTSVLRELLILLAQPSRLSLAPAHGNATEEQIFLPVPPLFLLSK